MSVKRTKNQEKIMKNFYKSRFYAALAVATGIADTATDMASAVKDVATEKMNEAKEFVHSTLAKKENDDNA